MSFKQFDGCSWSLAFFASLVGVVSIIGGVWPFVLCPDSFMGGVSFGGLFCFDYVSFCLGLLSVLICASLSFWVLSVSFFSRGMLVLSLSSALLCYSCVHAVWFWVFYEASIIPLLILLASDSPYSERYVGLWYFCGYVILGSLPMVLIILFFSELFGGYDMRFWVLCLKSDDSAILISGIVLSILFITKIPLLPFHAWLPIVHAEASSPVSVCLSGYIMKLGLLGVYRFCFDLVPAFCFNNSYAAVCMLVSIVFFVCALREIDIKRWIAFFSLGHISVAVSCLSFGGWQVCGLSFVYCLGHGLSAAGVFLFVWCISDLAGSRNLMLLKHALWGSFNLRVVFCLVLGTVCCFPPTVQFFSEFFLIIHAFWVSNHLLVIGLGLYVFFSGLSPVLFVGAMLARQYDVVFSGRDIFMPFSSVSFLIFWGFVAFFVC